ncbi:glycosyltransferase family A protein [Actinomadura violacea]|uniref:Glycosyltransferase family 2 protein n=1 Tax=Actinomadura violacea TaxID=2819934 RepID=A0ABS3RM14_9ACTN|nr:glycosyltransferase family A protein [Actinomadura violacea]MBO2457712.1 glycosyltransferase family 2 protein [Actinomadura violacea]
MLPDPDVTVVVVARGEPRGLARAVRSALEQSLPGVEVVIVDEAGGAASARAAARLVAGARDRVRAFALQERSGGDGRARNLGLRYARGRYVMFLDAADALDPHACKTMVTAAAQAGADLVAGRCVQASRGGERTGFPELYAERRLHPSISRAPELLDDAAAAGKCYRRAFLEREGLRFVDRLRHADLLFTAAAYAAAEPIAVVPDRVHHRSADHRGVPRTDLGDFADRLEILRRTGALLRARGAEALARRVEARFVGRVLPGCLRELRGREPGHRQAFVELARGYLAGLDEALLAGSGRMPAIAALMVLEGDASAAMAAADYAPRGAGRPVLAVEPVERDGRVYWPGAGLGTALGRRVLDITDLGIATAPLGALRLGGEVTRMRRAGRALRVSGTVANPLGRLGPGTGLGGALEIRDRHRAGRVFEVPVTVRARGGEITWEAVFVPDAVIRPTGLADRTWGLWLRLRAGASTVEVRLTSDGTAHRGLLLPVRPRLTRAAGDRLEPYVAETGELALRVAAAGWPARAALPALRRAGRSRLRPAARGRTGPPGDRLGDPASGPPARPAVR